MRSSSLLLSAALLVFAPLVSAADEPAPRPNIILIYMDDMGWGDLGSQGSVGFETPHLDQLAAEGTRLTDFYSVCSVCSASRAGLMTGCYAARVMERSVLFPDSKTALHPDEITIADMLSEAGYRTHMIGKWHLGHQPEVLPTEQGFESYYGVPYSNDMGCDPAMVLAEDCVFRKDTTRENFVETAGRRSPLAPLLRDKEVVEVPSDQATLTQRYTARATGLIEELADGDAPFFLYYAHTMPHKPIFASEDFVGTTERGLYGDVLSEIDWSIGQITAALRAAEVAENTLVLFTSDNGPWNTEGSAAHLRGFKFTNFEGGQRVPTIAWWPGAVPAGRVTDQLGSTIDIHPTLAALAGAEMKTRDSSPADGHDLSALLLGQTEESPRTDFFYWGNTCGNVPQGVRIGKWKLLTTVRKKKGDPDAGLGDAPYLFDLDADESETTNLAAEHPEVADRLLAMIAAFGEEIAAGTRPAWQAEE